MQKLLQLMKTHQPQPNLQTYAALLECLGHQKEFKQELAESVLAEIEEAV